MFKFILNILEKIKIQYMGNNMTNSTYQGGCLDYTKVQQSFNKIKKTKSNKRQELILSLRTDLNNFHDALNKLPKEEKQEELKNDKFSQLCKDISSLKNEELNKIIVSMTLTDFHKLSKKVGILDDKIDRLDNTVVEIRDKFLLGQGKNVDDILSIAESIPKNIDSKINKIHTDLSNSNKKLSEMIGNIKPPTLQKIPNDYLKNDDFKFIINEKLKNLKEIKENSESLEIIPAKINNIEKELKNLSEKMDNLPSSNSFQTPKHIPKEEKSVIALAKYMTDGVSQFENIAKEYLSKISELDKLDKIKEEHKKELEQVKKDELKTGKKSGKIELIKKLAENFPTEFKTIQSTFEDLLEDKFEKDETLEIADKNLNKILPFIEGKIENGKYQVISPALLVDEEILFKASVKKVD